MRSIINSLLPDGSSLRWIVANLYHYPIFFFPALIRSLWATYSLTGSLLPLRVRISPKQRLKIIKNSKANVLLKGNLILEPWGEVTSASSLTLGEGASLNILGDFVVGPGVHISVSKGASLKIGGRRSAGSSGITCNSRVMVEFSTEIGYDCIIAWDVFISDSDWHDIVGSERSIKTLIGNNVWIAHGATIAKGANVPSGCIVGAKSLVLRSEFKENSLIAGIPAKIRREDVEWNR